MLITMSEKDIYRFKVLSDVREKRLRQVDAAVILNVSSQFDFSNGLNKRIAGT